LYCKRASYGIKIFSQRDLHIKQEVLHVQNET
jgi:hypothetical protein